MKTLFTAEATSKGGHSVTIQTPDHLQHIILGNPLQTSGEKLGFRPELLFAGAYSACCHGALDDAGTKLSTPVEDSAVRALVGLVEEAVETRGKIKKGKVNHWQVTLKIGFTMRD